MRITIAFLFFLSWIASTAQERVTTVGLQFKPMVSNGLFNTRQTQAVEGHVTAGIDNQFGYAAGMVIRRGLNKQWSLEGGINYVKRNYSIVFQNSNTAEEVSSDFGVVGYEAPILGLVYIRLSEQIYMNAAFGASFDFYPSDVATAGNDFIHVSNRNSWIQVAGLANLGWEWRTQKNGYFYFGGSFHRPFNNMYVSALQYIEPKQRTDFYLNLNSSYATLDLRYFFHEDPEKRKSKKKKKPNKLKEFRKMQKDREKEQKKG